MSASLSSGTAQAQSGSYNAAAADGSTAIVNVYQAAAPRTVAHDEIAAATELLDGMPLGAPPPQPRGLPQPHLMPWRRNQSFVGREPDLLALARQIKQGGTAAVGQSPAVTGMGGQGKTQLAVEFAYRYGAWFRGGVFWLNCADPTTMAEAVAACGPALHTGDPGFSTRPLPERVALVASAWTSELPRLLIFDNCEDESILDDWVPKGGACRVLITARRLTWSPSRGITPLPLGGLTRAESVALLHGHRSDLPANDTGLAAIAEELGDLPLAIELAGRYLARYRDELSGTPTAYLNELRDDDVLDHASLAIMDPEEPDRSRLPTHHEKDVARTFEVSLRRLDANRPVDALAREVFARAAWLSPGVPIPRHLLKLCAQIAADDVDAGRRFSDALIRLAELALMENTGGRGAITLHRLLAAFARARMMQAETARSAVETVVGSEADRLLSQDDPTLFHEWGAHLTALAHAAARDATEPAVNLLNTAGYYYSLIADFAAAEAMLHEAVKRAETTYGPDHPEVARSLTNLGAVQREGGNWHAAELSLTCALAIKEKTYGPDHPQIAITLTNLGNVQHARGDQAAAESSQTRALAIKEKAYGFDHPQVALTLVNLGSVQAKRGDLVAAEASQSRAITIFEAAYGPDHPQVAITLTNLGIAQKDLGDLVAAEASLTRALLIKESVYGPDHPQAAITLGNLGIVQEEKGDLIAAEASQTRVLAIFRKVYGPDHPAVARAFANLDIVQRKRSDPQNREQQAP